jgi:hypothetical protein
VRGPRLLRPPVRRVRAHPAIQAFGSALVAVALTACGGSPQKANPNAAPFIEPPTEGTIVLYQAPETRQGRRLPADWVRITTEAAGAVAKDDPTRVTGGEIDDEAQGRRPTDKGTAREIMRQSLGRPFVVSPERFAGLCANLEEVGMFLLPRFRGGIPPQDKPYISFTTGGQTWVYLRPTDAVKDVPADPVKRQKVLSAWGPSKLLILHCTQG